ncbi:hypothetical protein A4A49_53961, partial [Nicotiana attenuata]
LPCPCQPSFPSCHCLYFPSHSLALAIESLCHHPAYPHFSLAHICCCHNPKCLCHCFWRTCHAMPPQHCPCCLVKPLPSAPCLSQGLGQYLPTTALNDNVLSVVRMIVSPAPRPMTRPSRPNPCHSHATPDDKESGPNKRSRFVGDGKANCGTMQLDTMALEPSPSQGTKLGSKSCIDKVNGGYGTCCAHGQQLSFVLKAGRS